MKNFFLFALFCYPFLLNVSLAKDHLNETILSEYLKIQKEFSDESCKPGTESAFMKFDKSYRGDGNFIPVLLDEKIDLKTIKNLIPLMKEKSEWIENQIEFIKKIENIKTLHFSLVRIQNNVSLLQEARKDFFFATDQVKKEELEKNANKQFDQLLKEVEQIKNQMPFLLSFKFPVNHLALRAEYEKFKNLDTKEARARANSIYFFRKIVQDGTFDEELTHNDALIRSAFDTLYLSLTKVPSRTFLSDNERVDLRYVLNNFEKLLNLKQFNLLSRFVEWKKRNDRAVAFYEDLAEGKKIKFSEESQIGDITSMLEERSRSLYTLKEFVLSREASTYEFWAKRSDFFQSLFVLETILYSEVGRMDAPDALERRDVAQVVINRSDNPAYNSLSQRDSLLKFLSPKFKASENKWLNVLFKEGEFSFTYFYITGNFHIYCPDMSKMGQFLRRENVRIAIEMLNKPKNQFTALRYFSRMSMFGRIEMDSLWNDFRAMPEAPGLPVRNSKKIYELFKKDHYKFLYDFTNEQLKKNFLVIELKGKNYVVDAKNFKQIYNYRNTHQFKYFTH